MSCTSDSALPLAHAIRRICHKAPHATRTSDGERLPCHLPERTSSSRYEFESYEDPIESRKWFERFGAEYQGTQWLRRNAATVSRIITDSMQCWVRVTHNQHLIAYARPNERPYGRLYPILSDVYVLRHHRGKRHFQRFISDLLKFTNAAGLCLGLDDTERFRDFYADLGYPRVVRNTSRDGTACNYLISEYLFQREHSKDLDGGPVPEHRSAINDC